MIAIDKQEKHIEADEVIFISNNIWIFFYPVLFSMASIL